MVQLKIKSGGPHEPPLFDANYVSQGMPRVLSFRFDGGASLSDSRILPAEGVFGPVRLVDPVGDCVQAEEHIVRRDIH